MAPVAASVAPFVQPFLTRVWDSVVRQFGYIVHAKKNIDRAKEAMEDLKAMRVDVQTEIGAAERKQQQSTQVVQRWLEKVELNENEVARLVNDHNQRGCRFCGQFSLNCWLNYKISRRAIDIHKDVKNLQSEQSTIELTTPTPPVRVQEIPSPSNIEAMGSYLQMVRSYLRDDTIGIVGIWGMGGVGKTTLLKAINNDIHRRSNNEGEEISFDHVIWVVASKELQIEKLQKNIAKDLGLRLPEDADMRATPMVIFDFLKDKNFLLLLDDLWHGIELGEIGIPYTNNKDVSGRHKRKVVFTTRFESVCGQMARKIMKVECLEEEKAWALFQENLSEGIIHSNPIIEDLAQQVAKECCGLPLALIIIGRAMSTKKDPHAWQHALTSLKNSQVILDMETSMYSGLKLSYDNLSDDRIRDCFLCCSLWPEDYEIAKEELIGCWMGLGLIQEHDDICDAYNHGHFLIGDLQEACLLEAGRWEGYVRMHDVIRDLALWIVSECGGNKNPWMVRAGVGAREAPCEAEKWREVERVSLMENDIAALPEQPFDCRNLSVLMLQSNRNLKHIPSGFFKCMSSSLTYLDLSFTDIEELPKEVGCLVELKYLNLSYTMMKSLPEELGGLSKLKYFLLRWTQIDFVPSRVISGMSSLQVLNAFPYTSVDTDWLDHTPGSLRAIGMRVDSIEALQKLRRLPTLEFRIENLKRLVRSLQLQLLGRNMAHCLQYLDIWNCRGLEELEGGALPRLEVLCLSKLRHLREIIWKGVAPAQCLQSLNYLEICECPKLKDVTWILQLPSLAELRLYDCSGMKQVIGGEAIKLLKEEEQAINLAFKKLKTLILNNLPKLVSICVVPLPFPSLKLVHVNRCPELRRLPFLAEMANDNKSLNIGGSRAWWEALNWEGDSIKSSFQPYFILEE